MGKKNKSKKCPQCEVCEKWAVPTADFFSLLLALFIALFAIASVNKEKVAALKEEFIKIYDFAAIPEATTPIINLNKQEEDMGHQGDKTDRESTMTQGGALFIGSPTPAKEEVSDIVEKIQQDLRSASLSGNPLEEAVDGVLFKLPAAILFNKASITITNDDMLLFVKRVAAIINMLPPYVQVSVRGHTDDLPLHKDSVFKDQIDLSNQRATLVVDELIKNGVSQNRLSTAGFGASNPVAPNDTEENRAKNRRVEFYMFIPSNMNLDEKKKKNILDVLSELKK